MGTVKATLTGVLCAAALAVPATAAMVTEDAKLTASDGAADDRFGSSVCVSGDTAVVGAYQDDDNGFYSGSAYVFVRSGSSWSKQAKLTASDGAVYNYFGNSVSVSGDTAVVGAYFDDVSAPQAGSAYVFVRSGSSWAEEARLAASDGAKNDFFGCSVSVSGDTAVVGAFFDDDSGSNSGSAYVFVRSGSLWTEQAKLRASDGAADDYFGVCVAVSGDTAIVGADGDDDKANASGSAYVFVRSGSSWSEQAKVTASDGAAGDHFGCSVSLSGNTAVVGAYQGDGSVSYSGSAYVYVSSGSSWSEQAKLTASDGATCDYFGWSVSVSGDTAVAGARWDSDKGSESGSAYVFVRSGSSWGEQAELTASDGATNDWFGISVSVSGETAVVGAYGDDDNGDKSGSAYIFGRNITVSLPPSAVEAVGTLVDQGTVSIPWIRTADVVVDLESSDTTELTVPATVTVPQGETSATFDLTIVDDGVNDGTQTVTVTASVLDWTPGSAEIAVLERVVTLQLPASAIEGDDALAGAGTVSIPGTWGTDLVIDLASSDTTELIVPPMVTIPQGQTSATFDLTIVDDGVRDETQTVTVTASATDWTSGSAEMDVIYKAVTPFAGGCTVFRRKATAGAGSATALLLAAAAVSFALGRRRARAT